MKKLVCLLSIGLALIVGCSSNDSPYFRLPENPLGEITMTDGYGGLNGSVEPTDWQLRPGYPEYGFEVEEGVIPDEVRGGIYVSPAYPNPTQIICRMEFQIPVCCEINLWAINSDGLLMMHYNYTRGPGSVVFVLIPKEDMEPLYRGIITIVYTLREVETGYIYSGHGDVEVYGWIDDD